jgi:dTDP-4-amino-4,6-dideoxygalactose transaminase
MVTPRTTGIIGVHTWGRACDVSALKEIAKRRKLKLIFDSAHAFGCSYEGRMIGGFGDAEVFSFHATKFINSGEGGAVVTNDDVLATRIRLMKNFGFSGLDQVTSIGTNGKMNELCAAMGLTNLESLEDFTRINRANFESYEDNLGEIRALRLLPYDAEQSPRYQYVVVEVDARAAGLTRDQLLSVLTAENVLARRYFYPGVHRMEPYISALTEAHLDLPQTEEVAARVLVLPTGTGVTPADIGKICSIIRLALENSVQVSEALARTAR